jgi:glycosyltransferase involved in cell wall biosynthesis
MRLAFYSTMHGAPWGGSEELWGQAAVRLKEEGHEVFASVEWWPQLSERVTRLRRHGIQVFTRRSRPTEVLKRSWRKLRGGVRRDLEALIRNKPDIVVISQGTALEGIEGIACVHRARVPFVIVVQCNTEVWWPYDELSVQMGTVFRAAQRVFCVSHHNLDLLEHQVGCSLPNGEVVWNPYGVRHEQQLRWPVPDGVLKLACVARLDPLSKGQDLLLPLLARPEWRERPLEVNFFGSGWCARTLRDWADRLQLTSVRFHGHVEDISKVWEHNHMLILPSRFEGLPLALVEAMWCARPALVTDVGGNAELCIDGSTGFVAAAPTEDLLARTLERAWSQRLDWEGMGRAARLRVEQLAPRDPVGDFCRQLMACA